MCLDTCITRSQWASEIRCWRPDSPTASGRCSCTDPGRSIGVGAPAPTSVSVLSSVLAPRLTYSKRSVLVHRSWSIDWSWCTCTDVSQRAGFGAGAPTHLQSAVGARAPILIHRLQSVHLHRCQSAYWVRCWHPDSPTVRRRCSCTDPGPSIEVGAPAPTSVSPLGSVQVTRLT